MACAHRRFPGQAGGMGAGSRGTNRLATQHSLASSASDIEFDVFVSYSRKDLAFARGLEQALERYRPPKDLQVAPRPVRVFRDERDLVGSEYEIAIERYLRSARMLIVIASPDARRSHYVGDEISRFVAIRGGGAIVPILFRGTPNNESAAGDSDEQAFPEALQRALRMPLAIDYRGFEAARERVDTGRFESSWFALLARIYGVSREEMEQRETRRRRQARHRIAGASALLAVVLMCLHLGAGGSCSRKQKRPPGGSQE